MVPFIDLEAVLWPFCGGFFCVTMIRGSWTTTLCHADGRDVTDRSLHRGFRSSAPVTARAVALAEVLASILALSSRTERTRRPPYLSSNIILSYLHTSA